MARHANNNGHQILNAQTGTTYTVAAADVGRLVTLTNAAAITLTVPQDSDDTDIDVGDVIDLYVGGAGTATVTAGTGATLVLSGPGANVVQNGVARVQKVAADTWVASGLLSV